MNWSGPMTSRQFEAWCTWLDEQWNHPSRSDHYAMQTSYHVARANAKSPNAVRMERMRLKFGTGQSNSVLSLQGRSERSEVEGRESGTRGETTQEVPIVDRNFRVNMAKAVSLSRLGSAKIRLPDGTYITRKEILQGKIPDKSDSVRADE